MWFTDWLPIKGSTGHMRFLVDEIIQMDQPEASLNAFCKYQLVQLGDFKGGCSAVLREKAEIRFRGES